jgi:D-sedoheptulose 7-phosphate isomerase
VNLSDFDAYLRQVSGAVDRLDRAQVMAVAQTLLDAWRRGATVYTLGNGGSASLASHMATDLGKNTAPDLGRGPQAPAAKRLRVVSLTDNTALLTALGNDVSYRDVFVEQLKAALAPADVVVAISGSGASPNVLAALDYARAVGATTVGLTGARASSAAMASRCDLVVAVPTETMEQIEDLHTVVNHVLAVTLRAAIATAGAVA